MSRIFPFLLCCAFLCTSIAQAAWAEEISVEKMISFADSLFQRGDYYRAITEYERVVFLYPDHPLATTARFQIAQSYLAGEKVDAAIGRFKELADAYPGQEVGIQSLFSLGEAHDRKGDFAGSSEAFTRLLDAYPRDALADRARLRLGWSLLEWGQWSRAQEEFGKVPDGSPLREKADGLARSAQEYPDIPTRSPTLAGAMSAILPGAGQLYVERPSDALTAFFLNAAFILAIVEANENDDHTTAGILLFFETGWYAGNIYNAVNGAYKYNIRSKRKYLDGLKERYGVSYLRGAGGRNLLAFMLYF